MKKHVFGVVLLALAFALSAQPGFGVSKEIIQMMTQLDNLQQEVESLQRTVDTQTAILKTLVEQTSQNVNAMKATIAKMAQAQQQSLANTNNQMDSMTNQIQQLSSSLDEAKGQIAKLSSQVAQTQKILQTINTPNPNAPPSPNANAAPGAQGAQGGAASAAGPGPAGDAPAQPPPVPDPQTLYNSAYQDYTQGQYSLAIQGFQQYLQNYGDTDLASNAQFYIGDSYYAQKDYKNAIKEYDKCIEQFPGGNKVAASYLKKGYALLALGETSAGERELRALIRRYPSSHEADLARQRLRRLLSRSRTH
ncbi:MAG TPA: tol-pal system protein YbgF [Terriglobia bacterium]|nr:tol-pal system protein YbgF [Terriglobia bacterium]